MGRSAGTGLMAFGIVLAVVGAILSFAVTVTTSGFSIRTIGLILLAAGIATFLVSLVVVLAGDERPGGRAARARRQRAGDRGA